MPALTRVKHPTPRPRRSAELTSVLEPPGRSRLDVGPGVILPEKLGVDPLRRIVVIEEQDEIPEAHEEIGAICGQFEGVVGPMDV